MGYEFHPLANIFPLMSERDMQNLVADIKKNGLLEPIVLFEGKILDGRNRYLACQELGLVVKTVNYDNGIDPLDYVLSLNLFRRHLSIWQKVELGEKLLPIETELAKKRYEASLPKKGEKGFQPMPPEISGNTGEAIDNVARKVGLGSGDILKQGIYVRHHAPEEELVKAMNENRKVSDFYKELKRWETLEEQKEKIKGLSAPEGKYDVIVIDPAWPYGTKYDPQGRRVASPYPEMSIEELDTLQLPAWDHCVLWLWTTNAFIHDALHLLQKWGFEQKTILTWGKNQIGLGDWLRGQTEHCILAVKGKPRINLTNQSTLLLANNTGHSVKPDEFYALVDSLCHGRKLDYFARKRREGWQAYGTFD